MLIDDAGLPSNNTPVGVGVYGWDVTKGDIYREVKTTNSWQDVDFTFKTGATLGSTQGVFFNSGTGYIDNWEMYEIVEPNKLENPGLLNRKVYVQNQKIISEFYLPISGVVKIDIFNTQGLLVYSQKDNFNNGNNRLTLNAGLKSGVYLIRMSFNGNTMTDKIIL